MRAEQLTTEEHDLLKKVRREGVLLLAAEARSFTEAQALQRSGLLRAVRHSDHREVRFVLSGAGIGLVGAPPADV